MFDRNWDLNTDAIVGIAVVIFLLMVFAFAGGTVMGAKWEKADAVKAGVAHWVADEKGDAKFEYNK